MAADDLDLSGLRRAVIRRREALGWSRNRLAERSGVPNPYLKRFEEGETGTVGLGTVRRLADALGVPVDVLLTEAGFPSSKLTAERLNGVYEQLDPIERDAWLQMGHTLREVQEAYAATQEHPEDDSEPEEPPSLHPPGTMGEIYNPAAYGGEDLRRAENRRRYDEEQRRKRQAGPEDS